MANQSKRILVVDDEEGIRYAIKRLLSKIGYDIIPAKSGEEALELMKEGPIHLLLTDIKLPGLDGLEVARNFKSSFPQAGILVLTGIPTVETARQAASLGVFEYLAKPFDKEALESAVKRCLEQADKPKKSYQNKLALIVEDNPSFLELLEALCGLRGIPVVTAIDAKEALARLQKKPYPDLLLVDVSLGPGMNGLELCRKVKDDPQTKHIPVILMTGTLEKRDCDEEVKKAGADLFTVKPMEPYELCFQMERLLEFGGLHVS